MPRGQPPRGQPVVLANLENRLGQPVQRGRRQARGVPGPLVLSNGVQEEALLIAVADHGVLAPLQREHVSQARLEGGLLAGIFAPGNERLNQGQHRTPGISHEPADYTNLSRIPGSTRGILRRSDQSSQQQLTCPDAATPAEAAPPNPCVLLLSRRLTAVVCSGRNRPQDSNGQWLPIPSERRSRAAETKRNSSWAPVSSSGAKPTSSTRMRSLRSRVSMTRPTELSARPR